MVFLVPTIRVFQDFLDFLFFGNQFFLVTPLHPLAHAIVCGAEPKVKGKCNNLFPHFWSAKHFFIENDNYGNKQEDFSDDDSNQKKRLVGFVNNLGYL